MGAQTKGMNTIASKEKRDEGEIMACSEEISVCLVVSCHQKTFKHAFYICHGDLKRVGALHQARC